MQNNESLSDSNANKQNADGVVDTHKSPSTDGSSGADIDKCSGTMDSTGDTNTNEQSKNKKDVSDNWYIIFMT